MPRGVDRRWSASVASPSPAGRSAGDGAPGSQAAGPRGCGTTARETRKRRRTRCGARVDGGRTTPSVSMRSRFAGTTGVDVPHLVSSSRAQPHELLDASPQLQDLLPELQLGEIRYLQTDHGRRRRAEPSTRRRARDTEIRGDGQVPGTLDEIPEPMVIALLRAGRGRHADGSSAVRSRRSTPQRRCGASVRVTTTRARKCKMSVETGRIAIVTISSHTMVMKQV